MKKLTIAVAAVALAFATQAATFNWKSSANAMGVDLTALDGDGSYGVGSSTMKQQGSSVWSVILAIYDGTTLVGESASTTIKFATTGGKVNNTSLTVDAAELGTAYNYVLTITGAPAGLTGLESDSWDYSGASLTATISGEITTAGMATTTLTSGVPSAWTVSGAVAKAPVDPGVPEPTSGLLALLGVAGLALRRKRA